MELEFNELRELLSVINQTDIAEFTLKSGEFELVVRKGMPLGELAPPANRAAIQEVAPPVAVAPTLPSSVAAPAPAPAPSRSNEKFLEVISPMVGTFYRSPAPDEPPFVDVGDRIRPGQTVCIIEAMKLMNDLESEVAGEIVEILAKNGEPVEYGQVLMRVIPG
ncbi:MAG TPA: acetyl-CoA carboxylase biotin carboxyl carrier protein [Coleofasciculaceae cyanobacterium]